MDVMERVDIEAAADTPQKATEDIAINVAFGASVLVAMAGWLYILGRGALLAISWIIG
ncbi:MULTISPECIES: hypothetical protein [unclassified Bradyrhizobium]|uniref:hypothetical protein n=1 Tax=unclassified Bradyrhizobium TaxID=2631580 RepID=UPI0024B155CA|nr:hypothetical protein [Bradyrhizobium sp. CB2312]WFU75143.1 hypothetical protein QA642_14500 [Bradyrhizobium sp. CB2312]